MTNYVYLGASIDGYISARDGGLGWLEYVPTPKGDDLGFADFMAKVDAVVMGRKTFETLIGFGVGWHYPKPGIILSTTMNEAPEAFAGHVEFASGTPQEIVDFAKAKGFGNLYIDGGDTVRRFLAEDMIDEMIITTIPILLGGGVQLFGELDEHLGFELVKSEVLAGQLSKRHFRRKRA
ncbi:dihydrofolate reductase family protein [Hyphococcus sp.]|jgi:dihydrofolate reductase|uniref:dihydrofolate reductase family protein n=1 Tax=Hyphococcus sp. TaxID=2038636 RepID=UPI003D0CB2AF